jgi:hypothetical protein
MIGIGYACCNITPKVKKISQLFYKDSIPPHFPSRLKQQHASIISRAGIIPANADQTLSATVAGGADRTKHP